MARPSTGKIVAGVAAAVVVTAGAVGLVSQADDGSSSAATTALGPTAIAAAATDGPAFEATFATPNDFYDRFDMGWSGQNPLAYGDGIRSYHGDHDTACGSPDTSRTVNLKGSSSNLDFSEVFWWCAPGNDPSKGHIMEGVDTKGYNTAWFSPKPVFTGISQVCWDINATDMGSRKWWTVLFVGEADAHRYPTGTPLTPNVNNQVARGTGGFDIGYTDPSFRQGDPNNGVFPFGGTLAGYRDVDRSASWFQDQDHWTTLFAYPNAVSAGSDKTTRFHYCLSNVAPNTVRITQDTPAGPLVRNMVGQIPQDARRVVFSDDNYNPTKDERLNPSNQTWHWDNIQVFTSGSAPPPSTIPPTSTIPTTVTTVPPTVTTATTVPTTVTTVPGETTTTSPFVTVPRESLEQLVISLEELIAAIRALLGG